MEQCPHSTIEGCIIGCYAIGAHIAYVYVRDELHLSKKRLWDAIKEAKAKGYLGKTPFGKDYLETLEGGFATMAASCARASRASMGANITLPPR